MNASDHAPAGQSDVLRSAWKRMVELDLQSSKVTKQSMQFRRWIAILGVVATFLAIVTNEVRGEVFDVIEQILRGLLILVPIVISVMAAYANKFFGGANGLVMRAGAEEIKKEIYLYRTVLRNHPERDKWLNRRMTTIQRRTYKSLGGELIIEPYEGKLPQYYNPDDPNSDPGFTDLTGDEYLSYRVIEQRDWHRRKIIQLEEERLKIQRTILVMGGLGALLAAIPPEWTPNWGLASWVALTAAVASAFTGWEQLRGLDKILPIYSRVILELTIIRDEWEAIAPHKRTEVDYIAMARAAEDVMWAQNMQFISTMQEAITSGQGDEAELVENMLKEGDAMTLDLQDKLIAEAKGVLSTASAELGKVVEESAATVKGMVGKVAATASGLQEKVQETIETEVVAFEDTVEGGFARVTAETAAVRTTVTQTVEAAMDEVSATRQLAETSTQAITTEAAAFRTTAQTTVDTARQEVAATRATIQRTTETVAAQAGAVRETIEETVSQQAETWRETTQAAAEKVSAETTAVRETAQGVVDAVISESAEVREVADTAFAKSGELRGMLDAELEKQAKEAKQKEGGGTEKPNGEDIRESVNAGLDALLGEAQSLIDEASEEMKVKMEEAVVHEIAELATEKNKGEKEEKGEKGEKGEKKENGKRSEGG